MKTCWNNIALAEIQKKWEYVSCSPCLFPVRDNILNNAASDGPFFSSCYFHVLFSIATKAWPLSFRAGKACNKIKQTNPHKIACVPGVCLLKGEWGTLNKSSKVSHGNIHMENLTRMYVCTHVSADLRQPWCGWRFEKERGKEPWEELCATERSANVKVLR